MVVIFLGSKADQDIGDNIIKHLRNFGIPYHLHIASAHKTPEFLLSLIHTYEHTQYARVYICVAGRSNALGGFVDAHTACPVINCPPYSDKYAGLDILSSLRMPSGIGTLTVIEPEQAAIAAAKIIGLKDATVLKKIQTYQLKMKKQTIDSNPGDNK